MCKARYGQRYGIRGPEDACLLVVMQDIEFTDDFLLKSISMSESRANPALQKLVLCFHGVRRSPQEKGAARW